MIKLTALSQNEVEKISKIFDHKQISYDVYLDEKTIESNQTSIRYNLRHLNSPSISTNILSIEVHDNFWEMLTDKEKIEFEKMGITELSEEQVHQAEQQDPDSIREVLNTGDKRLVGFHFLFYFAIIGIISFLINLF